MTGISWTDETWNPVRGCSQVSPGCANCFAKHQAARIVRMSKGKPSKYDDLVRLTARGEPAWTGKVVLDAETLADPLRWRRPRRIFVNSMSDLFHESLTNEQIAAVFGVMAAAPRHTFQILTKRARRMREWFEWARGEFTEQQRGLACAPNTFRAMLDAAYEELGKPCKPVLDEAWRRAADDDPWPLPNVWLGVSVENQDAADERIPELLDTPAAVRFLSCEPLLGPVRLTLHGSRVRDWDEDLKYDVLRGLTWTSPREWAEEEPPARGKDPRIDWVIDGCESGPGARPADPAWFRSIVEQCRAAGVAVFVKQIVVDGKLRKDMREFPADLQIQEFPR